MKTPPRDIRGALNGSRFVLQPHIQIEVQAFQQFILGPAPVLLEIGFDHGRRLHSMGLHNRHWRIAGLEVRKRRVEEARLRAANEGITNVYPWRMDARTIFACVLDPASIDVVDVFFPTPWWHPGLRQKRLLIEPHFLADVATVLRPGGSLRIATDVASYAERIEADLNTSGLIPVPLDQGHRSLPACSQLSRREWKCNRDGIEVYRWHYTIKPA
jgi:tRNA (guanine-N7-)-methyltransferase